MEIYDDSSAPSVQQDTLRTLFIYLFVYLFICGLFYDMQYSIGSMISEWWIGKDV
jgi:hypothetical protein